ncbi:MAG: acetyl-CoA carboxylase biotin carboxyl carrier protein [Steroidobacteraceae bacterium]
MTLTAKDVAEITRLLEESSFDEMTLELDGLKLTVKRQGTAAPGVSQPSGPIPRMSQQAEPQALAASAKEAAAGADRVAAPAPGVAPDDRAQDVTAPLLGTFYHSPKPGEPPFVEVGAAVVEDTIIGIIEVMKLMNTVRAGTRGTVVDILAKDGALVEYREPLMRVSKAPQP